MDISTTGISDIAFALQNRITLPATRALSDASATQVQSNANNQTGNTRKPENDEARDAANKFEALLIHSMLKSMRKNTMAENSSNERSLYDDMLDERLAETMIEAGGLGIADQIVEKIRQQQGDSSAELHSAADRDRLRSLADDIPRTPENEIGADRIISRAENRQNSNNIIHLQMANRLWGSESAPQMTRQQQDFVTPLIPHARRNANRIGTSPAAILAIAALETGWGKSPIKDQLGTQSNNLFGIKATGSDTGYATTLTTEYIEGSPQKLQAKFKTYDSLAASVDGFTEFLISNPRYTTALEHASDPERFLQELQNAGYATDPRYAEKAISIMQKIARSSKPL